MARYGHRPTRNGPNVKRTPNIRVYIWQRARKNGNPDYLVDIKDKPKLSKALHYAGIMSAGAGVRCDIMIDGVRQYRVWRNTARKILVSKNGNNVDYTKLLNTIAKGLHRGRINRNT